jgi:hypothetical protein
MYNLTIFKLPNIHIIEDLIKETEIVIISPNQSLPLFSLGFHQFIERTRESINITQKLETKNDFYYVVNTFETSISNYDDNITNLSQIYFNLNNDKPAILSTEFYKMWEINFIFDIINNKKLSYASLGNNGKSFLQSIIYFREKMLNINIDNDKIFNINDTIEETIQPEVLKQFTGLYNINTFTNKELKTNKQKIKSIKKEIIKNKKYANLIISNGIINSGSNNSVSNNSVSNNSGSNNIKEQDYYKYIINEIIIILSIIDIEGHCILKLLDTFTLPTIKLIWLLSDFFEESYIYKPLFSRPSEPEKFLICKKFKYNNNEELIDVVIKKLQDILNSINNENYINILFPNLDVPNELLNIFRFINIKLVNTQQIIINNIVKYIKDNNYFGDKYHEYRSNQIAATKWWIEMFFPPSNNLYINNKEIINKIIEDTLNMNNLEINQFVEQLI